MSKVAIMIRNKSFPFVTVILIAVNVIYYILTALNGNPSNTAYMLSRGASYAPLVFQFHEYWRIFTSMFLHFSFQHLAANMIYLGIVGWSYERISGHMKFLLIYLLSGIGGNVVSYAWHQLSGHPAVTAGASGAVYGIIAMTAYIMYIAHKRTGSGWVMYRIAIMLVFLFYSNFTNRSTVDVAAHIGGLVFGFLLSILFLTPKRKTGR